MSTTLVFLSVLLLSLSISAKSTGSTVASKTHGYSSQTSAQESPFSLDNYVKRTLLEGPEDQCREYRTLRRDFYDESRELWVLDDSAFDTNDVNIQCIVSRANPSETVMLSTNRTITPNRTITIDKPVTISGFHGHTLTSEGTYPAEENKTAISCPEGSDGSIFNILSGGVTIADLEIRDCSLHGYESPIVIRNCKSNSDGVRINHVDFVNNTHDSQLVAIDITNSSSCGELELSNVTFKDNQAEENVAVIRLGSTANITDVRIEDTARTENESGKAFLVFATSGTSSNNLTIEGLVLKGNKMPILRANSSAIEILNSNFTGNEAGTEDASMFQFSSATEIVVRNCTFENNTGEGRGMITLESVQYTEIRDSNFAYNTEFGSVIFSAGSDLKVRKSNFTSNRGDLNGGVIHLENSNARLKRTFFKENRSGQKGGSVYAINDSTLTVRDSDFINNTALEGGCFYIENSNVSIAGSTFHRNRADIDGGAMRVEQGGCVCKDSIFEDNNSMDEGGAIHIESARYVTMQSVNFTSEDAALGSVVRIDKSRTNVTLTDVHFSGGIVELTGAALYIDTTNVTIEGATFTNNRAPYGGAIYAQAFNITIRNAKFVNNAASVMGGAISGDNGNITFENTTFKENHSYLGGALHFYNTTVNASDIVFLDNRASEGGGLQCKNSNVTIRPLSGRERSIPSSPEVYSNSSFGIFAQNNTGIDNGGVIGAKDSNISIAYGNFSNNTAPEGGAIQVTSSELTSINISDSLFTENLADVRGGALAVRSANEGNVSLELSFTNFSRCIADQGGSVFLTSVNALIQNCVFVNNTAIEGGAALFQKNIKVIWKDNNVSESANISITVMNCLVERNRARVHGGALILRGEAIATRSPNPSDEGSVVLEYAEKGFNVSFKSVNVTGNRARRNGGGVYGETVGLDLQNVEVSNNNASQGGGVYLMRSTANISSSNISSNQAESSGGGIMMASQSNGIIVWTNFTCNRISEGGEGGGLSLSGSTITAKNLIFKQNNATFGGGASLVPGSQRNAPVEKMELDSGFLCFKCIFLNNNASSSGGGLNVQSQYREDPVVAELKECQFESNNATIFGGGIHFERSSNQTECLANWTSCSHMVILNTSFVNNTADRSGGSLLSNAWDQVLLNCSQSTDSTSSLQFISVTRAINFQTNRPILSSQCIDPGNRTQKTPPLVSSYARECIIKDVKDGNWNEIDDSSSIRIDKTVPGERLPDILIECYDEFGQFARSDYDDRFTATLKSKDDGYLEGIFVTDLTNGTGNITGVRNPPNENFNSSYPYELDITFSLDYVKPIKVFMNVRACRINEQNDSRGLQCKPCDATEYNFMPMNESCKPCNSSLSCSGTYVFPNDNFWHWSPCHVPAQKCLTAYACNETASLWDRINETEFGNLSAALNESSCNFSTTSLKEYHKLQCKEGYEGVLCGSCTEDYGRSLSFACTKCNGPMFSVFILGSVCVWLAFIALITIRGSMTIEERLSVIRKQLYDIASRRRFRFEESIPEETEIETQEENMENENTKTIKQKSKAHKRALAGSSRSTNSSYWIGHNLPTTTVTTTVETPEEINNLTLAQLAKWRLCEVFKVTINFLQAISVAAVINIEWTTYMLAMFNVSALAGGASTALMTRAIQCFPWWNGTRHATYVGLVSSILVPTFVILCIVATFALVAYKASKGVYYFVKRSTLASLAICYFSYISITKVAVIVFYCVGVRTGEFTSDEETMYWALDTSIQCADQDHKGLMVFGGILFLLFSVGFPLISAFILAHCRKGSGSRDPQWMTDILGFLYRAYKREFVYWESTVMLRKALLSVIAVFSYHLGGHSQGLLASCILSVCLFFQAIYKPYRVEFDTVNNIESLSLLISGITFTLAQFFMKDRTNEVVKVGLSVFLMVAIIGFLVYLALRMLVCLVDVLKTDLRVIGALTDENENSLSIVGTWFVARLGLSEHSRGDDDDDDLGDVELGSMKSENSAGNMSDTSS